MAIKKVAILIRIDTGEQERSCYSGRADKFPEGNSHAVSVPGADETYIVGIHNSSHSHERNFMEQPDRDEMLDCAAHELGHVLSGVFEYPEGIMNDPRQRGELPYPWSRPDAKQRERMLANEALAWKLAMKIRPGLDQGNAKDALDSYRRPQDASDGGLSLPDLDSIPANDREAARVAIGSLRELLNSPKVDKLLKEG